jgi:hypothetical protein
MNCLPGVQIPVAHPYETYLGQDAFLLCSVDIFQLGTAHGEWEQDL